MWNYLLNHPILLRFVKGGIAGAVGAMAVLTPFVGNSWDNLATWIVALSIAGLTGFISGGLQALEKWNRTRNGKTT